MSAEAERGEIKKAENGGHIRSSSTYFRENWSTLLKLAEMILAVFCLGLVVDPVNYGRLTQNNYHHTGLIYTAYGGYIIINSVIIIGRLLGEQIGWKTSLTFSLVGAIIFTAAGGVIISDWTKFMYNHIFHPSKHYMDMFISSGVFAIFLAVVFVFDAIFTYREEP